MKLDHTVVLVKNLAQAVADYTTLGFTVSAGGEHAGGISHNALIHFQDGTFIELLAIRGGWRTQILRLMYASKWLKSRRRTARYGMAYRFYGRALDLGSHREGITDFCLLADNEAHTRLAQNLELTPPFGAGRLRPDGQKVSWQMYTSLDNALPFFRTDYVPQITRDPASLQHANGVLGTQSTCLFTNSYTQTVQSYQTLFADNRPKTKADATVFALDNGSIEIIDNSIHRKATFEAVQVQGTGRFALVMKTENEPGFFDRIRQGNTHGLVFLEG